MSTEPVAKRRQVAGFTLVEILTALMVLMIALSGIIGLLYGSFRHGRSAADRSASAVLVPEAIRNIALSRYQTDGTYLTTSSLEQTNVCSAAGGYYRFKYRLVRHEDWLANGDNSPYKDSMPSRWSVTGMPSAMRASWCGFPIPSRPI